MLPIVALVSCNGSIEEATGPSTHTHIHMHTHTHTHTHKYTGQLCDTTRIVWQSRMQMSTHSGTLGKLEKSETVRT